MAEGNWADIRGDVGDRLLAQAPELTKELTERLSDVLTESQSSDPEIRRLLEQLARNTIVESMGAMRDLVPGPQARTVAAAIVLARRLAVAGISAHVTDQIFHVAQAWWQDTVLREFQRRQPTTSPMGLLAPIMHWQLRGFLGMADAAGQEHAAVLDSWDSEAGTQLGNQVAFVLSEVEVTAEAEDVLHYSMAARHLGLVIWSSRGQVQAPRLRKLVSSLGVEQGVIDMLVVSRDVSCIYVWVSLSGSVRQVVAGILRRTADLDVRIAIGEPLTGLDGFKATHAQALVARRMAQLPGSRKQRSIQYRDIAAARLLVNHPEDAEPWTAEVLGDLGRPGEENERLRETLRVYLESGENAIRAAGHLYVHRNTVKYRVARALEILAVPLEHNRLSVALALNYHHVALSDD